MNENEEEHEEAEIYFPDEELSKNKDNTINNSNGENENNKGGILGTQVENVREKLIEEREEKKTNLSNISKEEITSISKERPIITISMLKELQSLLMQHKVLKEDLESKRRRLMDQVEKRNKECYQYTIGVLTTHYQSKAITNANTLNQKERILCANEKDFLGGAYGVISKLLTLLQKDHQMFQLFCESLYPYLETDPNLIDTLTEDFALLFFADFTSPDKDNVIMLKIFNFFLEKTMEKRGASATIITDSGQLVHKFMKSFYKRSENKNYVKILFEEIFPNLTNLTEYYNELNNPQKEGLNSKQMPKMSEEELMGHQGGMQMKIFEGSQEVYIHSDHFNSPNQQRILHSQTVIMRSPEMQREHSSAIQQKSTYSPPVGHKETIFSKTTDDTTAFQPTDTSIQTTRSYNVAMKNNPHRYTMSVLNEQNREKRNYMKFMMIKTVCSEILNRIVAKLDQMPIALRYICKLLEQYFQIHFPEANMRKILGDLIFSKWLFLTLINPETHGITKYCLLEETSKRNIHEIVKVMKALITGHASTQIITDFIIEKSPIIEGYFERLLDIKLPDFGFVSENSNIDINPLMVFSVCISLKNLQNLLNILRGDIEIYTEKYPVLKAILRRIEYYTDEIHIFHGGNPKFQIYDRPKESSEEYSLSQRYILIQDIEIKEPKPELAVNPPEWYHKLELFFLEIDFTHYHMDSESLLNSKYKKEGSSLPCQNALVHLLESVQENPEIYSILSSNITSIKLLAVHLSSVFLTYSQALLYQELKSMIHYYSTFVQSLSTLMGKVEENMYITMAHIQRNSQLLRTQLSKVKSTVLNKVKSGRLIKDFKHIKLKVVLNTPKKSDRKEKRKKLHDSEDTPSPILTEHKIYILKEDKSKNYGVADMLFFGTSEKKKKDRNASFGTTLFVFENIKEFIQAYGSLPEVKELIITGNDKYKLHEVFTEYMGRIEKEINVNQLFLGYSEEERDTIYDEIENWIMINLYPRIYPQDPSLDDKKVFDLMKSLQWIKPKHLEIKAQDINEQMWKLAIQELNKMDNVPTPQGKLNCLIETYKLISEMLTLFSGHDEGVGADDSLPIFIYIILKACPRRIHSNLHYISAFRHPTKMLAQAGYCFTHINLAVKFLQEIQPETLHMDPGEFEKKMNLPEESLIDDLRTFSYYNLGELRSTSFMRTYSTFEPNKLLDWQTPQI